MKNYQRLVVLVSVIFLIALTNICNAQTEIKIPEDSLPSAVHDAVHKKYSNYKINSVAKKTGQQTVTYSLELQKKTTLLRLIYAADGNLISKDKSKIFTFDGTEPVKSKPAQSNDGHNHQH